MWHISKPETKKQTSWMTGEKMLLKSTRVTIFLVSETEHKQEQ